MPIKRKKRIQPLIPLASMGDIAFLLIIFFMLVGKFMKDNVEMDKAMSEDIEQVPAPKLLVTVDPEGVIRLEGIECGASELGPAIHALIGDDREQTVEVRIDNRLNRDVYMPVMEGLADSGARIILSGERTK